VSKPDVTIFVCVSCRDGGDADSRPGAVFLESLRARVEERALSITVEPVECLAVCKRPATVAFAAPGKWTYVIGDLELEAHVDELIDSARGFAASDNGIVPWKDRPACFMKGVVSRTPPLP
jgi:predicted metal-binding protein